MPFVRANTQIRTSLDAEGHGQAQHILKEVRVRIDIGAHDNPVQNRGIVGILPDVPHAQDPFAAALAMGGDTPRYR